MDRAGTAWYAGQESEVNDMDNYVTGRSGKNYKKSSLPHGGELLLERGIQQGDAASLRGCLSKDFLLGYAAVRAADYLVFVGLSVRKTGNCFNHILKIT